VSVHGLSLNLCLCLRLCRDFMSSEDVRRRYWARSYVGYRRMQQVVPNESHRVLSGEA
jgi:hypothetical protein